MRVKMTVSWEYDVDPTDYDLEDGHDLLKMVIETDTEPHNLIEALDYQFEKSLADVKISVERVDGA